MTRLSQAETLPATGPSNRYLASYGLGVVLVAAVVSVAYFLAARPVDPAGGQLNVLCLAVYLAAVAASAVRIVRGVRWRLLAWVWLAAILIVTVLLRSSLSPIQLSHQADWAYGAFGFVALVVLFGQRLTILLVALTVNCLIAVPVLIGSTQLDRDTLIAFASTAVGVSVFPIAGAVFYPQLERIALLAGRDADARRQLLARESKAQRVAEDRMHRSAAIEATVGPLLQAIASGAADPQDPAVRTAARIESARLRRLFAEVDDSGEPLLHEVRASMEAAERLGVAVTLQTRGRLPTLPVGVRRALLEAPMATLASAVSAARIVIMADAQSISISVVIDGPPGPEPSGSSLPTVQTVTTTADDVTWTQTTWEAGR